MVQLQNKLYELRQLVDDLYDMIQTPHHNMSVTFLEINSKIDDIENGLKYADAVENTLPNGYTMGEDLDWDDLKQVEELMGNKYQRMRAQCERRY